MISLHTGTPQHFGPPLNPLEVARMLRPADTTVFRESFKRGAEDISPVALYQLGARAVQNLDNWFNDIEGDGGILIPEKEFNEYFYRQGHKWNERMTFTQAQIGAELADRDLRYELLTSHADRDWSAMLSRAGGVLGPQFLDPVNYLPLAGLLGRATQLSRGLSRTKALGAEAGIIETARQGLMLGRDTVYGREFDAQSAMLSIGMGVGIGSGFGMMLDSGASFRQGLSYLGDSWDQLIVQGRRHVRLRANTEFPETPQPQASTADDVLEDLNTASVAAEAEVPDTALSPEAKARYDALKGVRQRAIALVRGCMTRIKGRT